MNSVIHLHYPMIVDLCNQDYSGVVEGQPKPPLTPQPAVTVPGTASAPPTPKAPAPYAPETEEDPDHAMEQGLEDRGDPVDSPELRQFLREQGFEHYCYVTHIGKNYGGSDRPGKRKLQKWLEQLSFLETFQDDAGVVCVRVRTQAMHIL